MELASSLQSRFFDIRRLLNACRVDAEQHVAVSRQTDMPDSEVTRTFLKVVGRELIGDDAITQGLRAEYARAIEEALSR